MIAVAVLATVVFSALNPPTTPYMFSEGRRVGGVKPDMGCDGRYRARDGTISRSRRGREFLSSLGP